MTRDELEHIIRASADLTDQYEFIIVGSLSILGPIPNPPEVFTMSAEATPSPSRSAEPGTRPPCGAKTRGGQCRTPRSTIT
jgi:hypothetical protein